MRAQLGSKSFRIFKKMPPTPFCTHPAPKSLYKGEPLLAILSKCIIFEKNLLIAHPLSGGVSLEASRYRGLDIGLSHKRAGIHLNGSKQWSYKGESKLSSLAIMIFRLFLPMVRVLVLQLGFPCLAAGNVGSWYMTLKEIWLLYLKEVFLTKGCFPILIFMGLLLCYSKKCIDKCIVFNYLPP